MDIIRSNTFHCSSKKRKRKTEEEPTFKEIVANFQQLTKTFSLRIKSFPENKTK